MITGSTLKKVVPTLSADRAEKLAEMIVFQCPKYGIDTADILHQFIPNLAHESGGFRIKDENLNYTAQRLLKVFGKKYFVNLIAAKRYHRQPEKIANYVYGGRMGNNTPGDGWKFRGGGFPQLTGKEIWLEYQKHVAFDKIETLLQATRTDDYWALDSACWFFCNKKKLLQLASDDKFKAIILAWNGGYNGIEDRNRIYERAKKYIT